MTVLTVIACALIFAGVVVFAGAGLGLIRFHDPYMRASAVGTAAGLGIALITIGAALTMPSTANLVKAGLAVVLQLATSAVGTTIIARAAVNSGHDFSPSTDLSHAQQIDPTLLAALLEDDAETSPRSNGASMESPPSDPG